MSTLSFETFWSWLLLHPNCILRAGTHDAVLFDDDDLHWHLAGEGSSLCVQVMRGKRLIGELLLEPDRVSYVQALAEDHEEFVFELISESDASRSTAYVFVLAHGFDEEDTPSPGRVH